MIKRFSMYRRGELPETHTDAHKNAPDEIQFEGVVFSDGRCALRWLTPIRSVSVWDSLEDALTIHGHPEYESEIVWHDDRLKLALEKIAELDYESHPACAIAVEALALVSLEESP